MEKTAGGTYDGNQAVGVPRDNYTLGAEYDIRPLEGLTATALITHTGSQSLDDAHFTIVVLAVTSVTLIIFVLIITLWMS